MGLSEIENRIIHVLGKNEVHVAGAEGIGPIGGIFSLEEKNHLPSLPIIALLE